MQMQLPLELIARPTIQSRPIFQYPTWMDVSHIAKGVGFVTSVEISVALNDALEPLQAENEANYDQHLYDALWLAHHYIALDQRDSFSFTFDFLRDDKVIGRLEEISLRLRVEVQKNLTLLGLSQDF